MRRQLLLVTAVTLVLALPSAAGSVHLQGTFKTVISNAFTEQLDGTWQVDLLPSGHYTIERNHAVMIRGRDTQTATTITFGHETGPAACPGRGATYRWSLHAAILRLTPVSESCIGRHVVLTTHTLKKTG